MGSKFKYYFGKFLTIIRVRPIIGGLGISDSAVRLIYSDGKSWRLGGVRLEPGVLEDGKIKDRSRFVEALKSAKTQVFGKKYEKIRVDVIASLSSTSIYSQVFSLPIIEGKNLDQAVQLNIQMVSPVDLARTYSGWQMVGKDERSLRLEILAAFIDRALVDELNKALQDAGFLLVVLEPKAFSIARLVREQGVGVDIDKPYIVMSSDDSGLDFLIVRHGQPYFDYFNPWREIADEKGQVPPEFFRAAVTRSLYQVLNFYGQHWSETISEVIISTATLKDEIDKIIKDDSPLVARELRLKLFRETIGPEWFTSVSCLLRSFKPRGADKEISLLGIEAGEEFRRERLAGFAAFWRLVTPILLGLLSVLFILSDLFLVQTTRSLESQSSFNLSGAQVGDSQLLRAKAQDFNRTVALIRKVQSGTLVKSDVVRRVHKILTENGASADRLYFQAVDAPVTLSGRAESENKLSAFKSAMEKEPLFKEVSLPLSGVKTEAAGVSFSMTFRINQQKGD